MASTLNIAAYRFVAIDDPRAVAAWLEQICAEQGLKGSALVAPEGLNLFLAGSHEGVRAVLAMVAADDRFTGLDVKASESDVVPFRRLRIKCKDEIISFGKRALGAKRAPVVSAERLGQWLHQGRDDSGREVVLLDTRNRQEVAFGTFAGALTLPIDSFTQLPAAIDAVAPALAGKTVVSFCTGGIRCEKAALWMAEAGHGPVLQLEGGILGYFEKMGGEKFEGACFVFDERVALDPRLKPIGA